MDNLKEIVNQIDAVIRRKRLWFDFHVYSYDGRKLIIAGSEDLTYYHQLEVIFEGISFFSGYFDEWHSDTSKPVFILSSLDTESKLNLEYEILAGSHSFMFKTEDQITDVVITARKVSFNTDTVLYYFREDLKENERLADFVKRERT